jgi:3-methyladenine DNA glycosylase AlkD
MNIDVILNKHIDQKYREFHKRICTTKYVILGIRLPILKSICKDLIKKYDYKDIINSLNNKYYEHILLEGLVIANIKINNDERLKLIDKYLKKIDNWAICDSFCCSLKMFKKEQDKYIKIIDKYINSNKEYYVRFSIVILLLYYINDNYIDYVLNKLVSIKNEEYYVKMAISWAISVCLVKYFNKTKKYLEDNKYNFDLFVYNKALQKARESYRLKEEEKNILKEMKRLS